MSFAVDSLRLLDMRPTWPGTPCPICKKMIPHTVKEHELGRVQ